MLFNARRYFSRWNSHKETNLDFGSHYCRGDCCHIGKKIGQEFGFISVKFALSCFSCESLLNSNRVDCTPVDEADEWVCGFSVAKHHNWRPEHGNNNDSLAGIQTGDWWVWANWLGVVVGHCDHCNCPISFQVLGPLKHRGIQSAILNVLVNSVFIHLWRCDLCINFHEHSIHRVFIPALNIPQSRRLGVVFLQQKS